jgi:hypothetical protein
VKFNIGYEPLPNCRKSLVALARRFLATNTALKIYSTVSGCQPFAGRGILFARQMFVTCAENALRRGDGWVNPAISQQN